MTEKIYPGNFYRVPGRKTTALDICRPAKTYFFLYWVVLFVLRPVVDRTNHFEESKLYKRKGSDCQIFGIRGEVKGFLEKKNRINYYRGGKRVFLLKAIYDLFLFNYDIN